MVETSEGSFMPLSGSRMMVLTVWLLAPVFAHGALASPVISGDRGVTLARTVRQLPVSGLYKGQVNRGSVSGQTTAARIYRVRLNDDKTTGTIDVYELNGQLVAHLGFAGELDGDTFVGKTVVLNAPADYIPDDLRLVFSPDHRSLRWYHNDGRMQGSGVLSR
jgi:hypothetical protein